jgi:putative peptide modification system cyclase
MSATAIRPSKSPVGSAVTPLLRAVLLADLVDSTAFIERFGDANAAAALQRLDLQIRDLLHFTGGRLIDKADGLLAIFERPIQAVDFALRYQQMLRQISDGASGELKARVGIHVGELMTWSNSPDAVAAGAKPLEVEGLAKPVAARLMSLAMPGQILLSSMAQTLAQRAAPELGERESRLRWTVHGRYRFKGVPAPLLVHEVGEVGTAPLRAPASTAKAWREVPFWRRPPVLAAEALMFVAVVVFTGYALLRSPPALGFKERDWVVLGDVSNFTGDATMKESAEAAMRIGLEQSRFVNILSDTKVQEVLKRMGRPQQAAVDRALASEIALREGARAVLLPSVTQDGANLRVSVEVVDPTNQNTVFAESAEGRSTQSLMRSIDNINGKLRARLGESMAQIQTSVPLEKATTGSIDALRSFSLALAAGRAGRWGESLQLLDQAIALDPEFAVAYMDRAQIWESSGGQDERARADYAMAVKYRARMSARERLTLDVNLARSKPPLSQLRAFEAFGRMYPDHYGVGMETARIQFAYLHRYADAERNVRRALMQQNPMRGNAFVNLGGYLLAQERFAEAAAAFAESQAAQGQAFSRQRADMYAAQRDFANAERTLAMQLQPSGLVAEDADATIPLVTWNADRGRIAEAARVAAGLQAQSAEGSREVSRRFAIMSLSLRGYAHDPSALAAWRELLAEEARHAGQPRHPHRFHALFAATLAAGQVARLGDPAVAQAAVDKLAAPATSAGYPTLVDLLRIAQAEIALAGKQPEKAIALLKPRATGTELMLLHATLGRAYRAAGQDEQAAECARWLAARRGRAYAEWGDEWLLQPITVVETDLALLDGAELAARAGRMTEAAALATQFERAWAQPPAAEAARLRALRQQLAGTAKAKAKRPAKATVPPPAAMPSPGVGEG